MDLRRYRSEKRATAPTTDRFKLTSGAFEIGGSSIYDGSLYVKRSLELGQPVIFVAPNYRLNGPSYPR